MKSIFLSYLPWILPPLIGAAIGYITNAIAIAMLFRPYTQKRLLGLKIPMTPGIIPRQRYELSGSIGRLVSRELLTEDALRGQIGSESFSSEMEKAVHSFVMTLSTTPLREIKEVLSLKKMVPVENKSVTLSVIMEIINSFLSSEGLFAVIDKFLDKGITYAGGKTLNDLARSFPGLLENGAALIFSEGSKKNAASFLRRLVEEGIYNNVKLSSFIRPDNTEKIISFIFKLYDLGFPKFIEWLREPNIKKELELRGRFILEDILEKLNKVQRFFLSVGQYDKTLEENMGAIINDVIEQFKNAGTDSRNKEKLHAVILSFLERISLLSLGEVAAAWEGNFTEDVEAAAGYVSSLIFTSGMRTRFVRNIKLFIERKGSYTLEYILNSWTGITLNTVKEKISVFLQSTLPGRKETALKESYVIKTLLPEIFNALTDDGKGSLQEILNLDNELLEKISKSTSVILLDLIDSKIPEILTSVDIRTLVVKKIDSLEIEKVEELILEVVKKQLRWINLFGALLGSLIGGAQIILNLYAR